MGVWTIEYRMNPGESFIQAESVGAAGLPPFFDQITTEEFLTAEIFATHSDEPNVTFHKPFKTIDWERTESQPFK